MDDLQRQPRDGDRNPVRDRIKRAVADGRISAADGDIRLTNVGSAQSMSELGLIVRDLDQLESTIPAGSPTVGVPTPSVPTTGVSTSGGGRSVALVLVAVLLVALVGAGAAAFFVFSGSSTPTQTSGSDLPTALPIETASVTPSGPGGSSDTPGASYRLSAEGIRTFVAAYQERFSTTKVIGANFYDGYVIVDVPVPGKARHSGWDYRNGEFSDFGGVTANFPGSAAVDLRKLDVAALVRNIARARKVLKVEDYNQTYVVVSYRPEFDDVPNVNIYVANSFNESGYLATTLSGGVERTYPFGG